MQMVASWNLRWICTLNTHLQTNEIMCWYLSTQIFVCDNMWRKRRFGTPEMVKYWNIFVNMCKGAYSMNLTFKVYLYHFTMFKLRIEMKWLITKMIYIHLISWSVMFWNVQCDLFFSFLGTISLSQDKLCTGEEIFCSALSLEKSVVMISTQSFPLEKDVYFVQCKYGWLYYLIFYRQALHQAKIHNM